ncbi:MAG: DUF1593 domain-containing protein, partial [Blautia sp.]|nr:DUF1593 domain-containing protein [Blautia sp.]
MKRALLITLSAGLILGGTSVIMAEETEQIDKSTQPRVIITTDGECDDQNSFRHMLLYANDLDIAGIVYSASSFHWQGDGEHSLAEVNENYLYKGEDADTLMVYRPQEMGWIESVINDEYAVDYEYLSQNAQGYPTPDELLSKVKVGNVEFEGDLREPSEGSEWIKQCILDDDERTLYIQAWGGFNTTARALLSIAEEYRDTDQWKDIYRKVCKKVRLQARSQDTTYKNVIAELYPNLTEIGSANIGYGYFASQQNSAHVLEYFGGEWLSENIKFNHGKMLENYHLIGDGAYYEGELDQYQMGQSTTVQWGSTPREFALYDWV